jgi:hypothetical protein
MGNVLLSRAGAYVHARSASSELAWLRRTHTTDGTLVCGPLLGEPGFETLYWAPFLKRVAEPVLDKGREVLIISRGGAEALYGGLLDRGARYLDVIDVLGAERFLALERERVRNPMSKNQKAAEPSVQEQTILEEAGLECHRALRPFQMFAMLSRHSHAEVCDWTGWPEERDGREDVTVVKFWFGGQLPETAENVQRLERLIGTLRERSRVAAVHNEHSLDLNRDTDRAFDELVRRLELDVWETSSIRTNLGDQIAMFRRASRISCTYGGMCYLSLYTNTPLMSYYSNPGVVFSRHFVNFAAAIAARNHKGAKDRLAVSLVDLSET